MPKVFTIGIKIGRVIIMIDTCSIKQPKRTTMANMMIKTQKGPTAAPRTSWSIPRLAPEKARTWLKAAEAAMMVRIITVTWSELRIDFLIT